jgi:hypothetical protein
MSKTGLQMAMDQRLLSRHVSKVNNVPINFGLQDVLSYLPAPKKFIEPYL